MSLAELPRVAQDAFAVIVDSYCIDVFDDAPQSEILDYGYALDENIAGLKAAGFSLCAAFRDTAFTKDVG